MALLFITLLNSVSVLVNAAPTGPTVDILGNSTKTVGPGTKVNSTINGTISPGGFIFTLKLTSTQQNTKWKGYVGNVSGTLTLDDASDNTLFQWATTATAGEVYATRSSGSINWTAINCTWVAEGSFNASSSNRSAESKENSALSHSQTAEDNINATFSQTNHSSIVVGARTIGKNECFSVQTWQRDGTQTFADSDNANFTQVLLYDGAYNTTNSNVVYETKIDNDVEGYKNDGSTFDFQMILPEVATPGFTGSTAYYFYVELT